MWWLHFSINRKFKVNLRFREIISRWRQDWKPIFFCIHTTKMYPLVLHLSRRSQPLTFRSTAYERISDSIRWTGTNGVMMNDWATSVQATSAGTRIGAFLSDTRQIRIAFGADYALRPTMRRRTDEILPTRAHRLIVNYLTMTIRSAWWRLTGIDWNWSYEIGNTKN